MEIGSLTDWIIAFANTVMAGAAMYAAINAENWLTAKKNDYAIKHLVEYHQLLVKLKSDLNFLKIHLNKKYSNDNQDCIDQALNSIGAKYIELINLKEYASALSCEINDQNVIYDIVFIRTHSLAYLGESFRKANNRSTNAVMSAASNAMGTYSYKEIIDKADEIRTEVLSCILHLYEKIESLKISDMLANK
ncbi:hypothetical protein [Serratia fonticola]|uniref:hypothetical protein n=1 Tax=Serratia fonticola TaxID=47917 RepID=UPI0034C6BDDF